MRAAHSSSSFAAPSSTLIQFLRSQAESFCFSRPCPAIPPTGLRGPKYNSQCKANYRSRHQSTRCLHTSSHRQAAVESSILNLNFLRRGSGSYRGRLQHLSPRIESAVGSGIVVNCKSKNGANCSRSLWDDRGTFLRRLWQPKRPKQDALKPTDVPGYAGTMGDGNRATIGQLAAKVPNELKLRCTEFDENGNVILVNGELKKSEMTAKVGLLEAH